MQRSWTQLGKELALGAVLLSLASGVCAAASSAVVSGVVRDTQGVAQMGAMVQVLAANSASVATAFTDMYGRYRIANLIPGRYQVRATAALFMPATRGNLQLATGMRATVNLTLSMLSDPTAWLPAQRRKPDEPGDDWTWTLRSAENRSILRMLDDGELVLVSAGAGDAPRKTSAMAHAAVLSGDGDFGGGGVRTVVSLDRALGSGTDVVLRAAVASAGMQDGRAPATELDAGYERGAEFSGVSRMVTSYSSHPEIISSGDAAGMQLMRMSSARKIRLGDTIDLEAGGTVYAVHTDGYAVATQPFVRVTVHPGEVWAVRYGLATARDVQSVDGLDSLGASLPVTAMSGGRLRTESGTHQEIGVGRRAGGGLIEATVYRDAINRSAIGGTGMMSAADMLPGTASTGVMVDTATGNFRFLGAGYTASGFSVALSEPVTPGLWAEVECESGAALSARNSGGEDLQGASAGLHPEAAGAATVALKGRLLRTGTKIRAAYRWQSQHLVTAVDPYAAFSDQGYLSFYVRQAMHWGDHLPSGLEATIDVTNLLAEGYQPFLSADGRTLFLAESTRTIQGGLSFTF